MLQEQEEPKLPPPTDHELYHMAAEIADGMAYLTDNKFVHRYNLDVTFLLLAPNPYVVYIRQGCISTSIST